MRFSLAAALPLALFSLAGAQPADPTAEEKAAIDAIAKAGGKGEIDPKLAPTARVVAKFEAGTDAALAALKKRPQVGAVEVFDATRCTEKGLVVLKDLPELRRLALGKSDLTLARVNAIAKCKELRDLRLPGAGLSDPELAPLKALTRLEQLDLSENAQVTDKGMATVKTLERLRGLYLAKTGLTDKGLAELKGLEGLRSLYVGGTKVTADAAEQFADDMPNLRVVRR
ncbi:Leucine Rich repeats (2 copies) [Gemmata obscuriglobus]|uniref:leucine-rich repeat domain-containing protein n=1 Tax=Gemmata obscuriglobus TaxID=114 RepID=UPI00016C3B87|nr:hypothetical protein [Gemmata obscuriglobus]QEG31134.1 Leucine Rich repeats (2 copies) [Gemmata obscuriglobus]VTS10471.1 Uncharacterized protein OS=Pirellula staleyi (strain ATCC 27377 / DSM 6068 / ICPB 4128) GN=Psta_0882 PE=4 SV=1: LRR_6 [Gemmata obscuriglobus UQM 2246]